MRMILNWELYLGLGCGCCSHQWGMLYISRVHSKQIPWVTPWITTKNSTILANKSPNVLPVGYAFKGEQNPYTKIASCKGTWGSPLCAPGCQWNNAEHTTMDVLAWLESQYPTNKAQYVTQLLHIIPENPWCHHQTHNFHSKRGSRKFLTCMARVIWCMQTSTLAG